MIDEAVFVDKGINGGSAISTIFSRPMTLEKWKCPRTVSMLAGKIKTSRFNLSTCSVVFTLHNKLNKKNVYLFNRCCMHSCDINLIFVKWTYKGPKQLLYELIVRYPIQQYII